ncbi:hypothetical protein F6Y02_02105 [Bacillus megaterium]|nr:hypothetical protein [Priestia megaterium]
MSLAKSFAKSIVASSSRYSIRKCGIRCLCSTKCQPHATKQTESKTQSSASGTAQKKRQAGKVVINTKTAFCRRAGFREQPKAVLSFGEIYQVLEEKKILLKI